MFNMRKSILATAILAGTLGLTACGGSSDSKEKPVEPVNTAPTDITLSANSVSENAIAAEVGTLTATDSDSGDTFTFSTSDERFEISGTSLKLKADTSIDFEKETSVTVKVSVSDSANNTFEKDLTIEVTDLLDFYGFTSRFEDGESTVSYSGQIARHVLIKEIYNYIGSDKFVTDAQTLDKAGLQTELDKIYRVTSDDYASVWEDRLLTVTTNPTAKQTSLLDISSSHKNIVGKLAGNDSKGQHKDWTDGTSFKGWDGLTNNTPEGLVDELFDQLTDRALIAGGASTPNGLEIDTIYVTADGVDLKQLIQKFLLGAVAFSQGADDYLDNDYEGKGLLTDNVNQLDGKTYTNLEHQWDEGFGYFGAARDYLNYTDTEIAGKVSDEDGRSDWNGKHDTNADDLIDLKAEYNFGNSTNAAKRDRGATVATDLTKEAMDAFLAGRNLIATTHEAFTDEQAAELKGYAKTATIAWEKSISATVVHYINDLIADLDKLKGEYSVSDFTTMAKHFSEMKGFALNLQFNPESPMTSAQFAEVNTLLGNKPVIVGEAEILEYQTQLLEARNILQAAYDFDADNVQNW